jgi:quercetin dioxygenase-like cupin family protein
MNQAPMKTKMKPVIKNKNDHKSHPILGSQDGVPTVVSLYHDHQPGETSTHHTHPWEHQAYITRGEGIIFVDGEKFPIKEGDFVLVPPNADHYFENTGTSVLSRVTFNPLASEGHLG